MVLKVLVYGNSDFAKLIASYIKNDKKYYFLGFTVEKKFIVKDKLFDEELYPFEDLQNYFDFKPNIILAIGYSKLNLTRKKVFEQIVDDGYKVINYFHSSVMINANSKIGFGNILLENVVIQPFVTIGDSNIFFASGVVSHDTNIGSFNYFSPGVIVSGKTTIGNMNFFGSNSTIKHGITITDSIIVGANAYVKFDIPKFSVVVPSESSILEKSSLEIKL